MNYAQVFDYILLKIREKDLMEDARRRQRHLQFIHQKRYYLKELDQLGECCQRIKAFYFIDDKIREVEYLEKNKVVTSYLSDDYKLHPLPRATKLEFKFTKKGKKKYCLVHLRSFIKEEKLIFKLDEDYRLIALKKAFPQHSWPHTYICFFEEYDENGNWLSVRETINEQTYLTKRTIAYY